MSVIDDERLNDVKNDVRRDAALRSAAAGPLVGIAALLRDYCRLDAELRAVIERLPYELGPARRPTAPRVRAAVVGREERGLTQPDGGGGHDERF